MSAVGPVGRAVGARLLEYAGRAATRATRSGRPVLVAVTVPVAATVDGAAVLVAARRPAEPWFVVEQPDRDQAQVAAIGAVAAIGGDGGDMKADPDRFAAVAAGWRELLRSAVCDPPTDGPVGGGPIACGGFAFAPAGARSSRWQDFGPVGIAVPELAIVRRRQRAQLTITVLIEPGGDYRRPVAAALSRARKLDYQIRLPSEQPQRQRSLAVKSVLPPEHFAAAVAAAVERIGREEIEKIVLARTVDVTAAVDYRPQLLLAAMRARYPDCHLFCVGRGESVFLGASPELLIRREGLRASTLALAGSTARSADPRVDAELAAALLNSAKDRKEHRIVVGRILRSLRPQAVWATAAPQPLLAQIAGIQHLATPIRAQLTQPVPTIELAGLLHPTPAVGAEPATGLSLIPALEAIDRGWYAGPIGWSDAAEDGEFIVGLRSALIGGRSARCFVGVGVVGDSDPATELAETEIKLGAMLSVLKH